ncbi:MAG: hypothetical protein B6241_12925 [Spirochaetaceae bacterium 4572_59]|nr:MAG: hypothetical protein B6241_12925 [Spirochaetaceae bacterium 4572_59]
MRIIIEELGGSRIIRLPEDVLKNCKAGDQIQIKALNCALLIKADQDSIRSDWTAQMQNKGRKRLENLLIEESSIFDMDDWEW